MYKMYKNMITGKCFMRQIVLLTLAFCVGAFFAYCDNVGAKTNTDCLFFVLPYNNVILLAVMVIAYRALKKMNADSRLLTSAVTGGVCLGLCYTLGHSLDNADTLYDGETNLLSMLIAMIRFVGCCTFFFGVVFFVFKNMMCLQDKKCRVPDKMERLFHFSFKKYFIILLAIRMCFLLILLPGMCSSDTFNQISQGLNLNSWPMTNHHPVMMTIFLGWTIRLGEYLFHSVAAGLFIYTLIQVIATSAIIAYVLNYLYKRNTNSSVFYLACFYLILHPVFSLYSITIWKDVWLSHFILVYSLLLYETCIQKEFDKRRCVFLVLASICMIFSKNTGIVIFLLTYPFILFVKYKNMPKYALVFCFILMFSYVLKMGVFNIYNVTPGDKREALSLFFQPLARTMRDKSYELENKDVQLIRNLIPMDSIGERYNPQSSDPIKCHVNTRVLENNISGYASLYFRLAVKYPKIFLDDFGSKTFGYWYPTPIRYAFCESTYCVEMDYEKQLIAENRTSDNDYRHCVFEYDKNRYSHFLTRLQHHIAQSFRIVLYIPLLSLFTNVGFASWIFFLCGLFFIYKKRYKLLMLMLPNFVVWLTCLASPGSNDFRYTFPIFLILPVLIGFIFQTKSNENNSNSDSMLQREQND